MQKNITEKYISNITENPVLFNHNLAAHTSFRIGGPADFVVFPKTVKEISEISMTAANLEIPLTVLGGGSNTLIKDQGIRGIVMIISGRKANTNSLILKKENNLGILRVSSGIDMKTTCLFSIKNSLLGISFALGIPGTIGGAIAMNSGSVKKSISDILHSITLLHTNGSIEKITNSSDNLLYEEYLKKKATTSILECELALIPDNQKKVRMEARHAILKRKNTQPTNSANAGCFFKNPKSCLSAGELIDKAGLKGTRIGDAIVSKQHGNFIINENKATASDVLKLADLVRKSVFKYSQIILEPEVCIMGN